MLETINDFALVIGWPKLTLAGLVILVSLAPRGLIWRVGSAALAVAVAASFAWVDLYEKRRTYAEHHQLRQYARNAVLEQRTQKIEAEKTRRVVDSLAREIIAEDKRALMLHDSAIRYDAALADTYVDRFLQLAPANNPSLAALWSLEVFIGRMNAELPEAGDNVLYFLARGYEPLFRRLKAVDPQACSAFMAGKGLLGPAALGDTFAAVELAFRTMPDKTRPVSKGTRAEAIAFGERALGPERLSELMAQTQPVADTCEDLATLYAAIQADGSPAAFAAGRYWLQPHRLQAP